MAREKVAGVKPGQPCPFHARCSKDWGIPEAHDLCVHEQNDTITECPSLIQKGDLYAYQNIAGEN
jgi:hypothetical protein